MLVAITGALASGEFLDASLVKQTNIETLITTLDGVQDSALTKLGEIETILVTHPFVKEVATFVVTAKKTEEAIRTGRSILSANWGALFFIIIPRLSGIANITIKVLKISAVGEAIFAASAK